MIYSIEFRSTVFKDIKGFPKRDLVRIKKRIDTLSTDLPDSTTTKINDNNLLHKVRSGAYRIIYEIHDDKLDVLVVKIGHRKDVYKKIS